MQNCREEKRNFTIIRRRTLFVKMILTFMMPCVLYLTCTNPKVEISPQKNVILDRLVNDRTPDDSLTILLDRFLIDNNLEGLMYVFREMGRRSHAESDFSSSLEHSSKALEMAEQTGDTMEIMNSLNNIGTCLRRMGIMGEASSAFYRSLSVFEEYSGKSEFYAKKRRLVALNSIGNINKTLGNFNAADSLFRIALHGALELEDIVGAAINTANIGLTFKEHAQYDSAWVYLRRSMDYNIEAGYRIGVTITHVNYGLLYELQGDLDNALREFQIVISDTINASNRWQWLMSCISYARLHIRKGNLDIAEPYLEKAWKMAHDIRSLTHLSEVSRLYYMYFEKNHDYSKALDYHIKHKMYADSLRRNENNEQMQNLRERYAMDQSHRELSMVTNNYRIKQQNKNRILVIGGLALLLSVTTLGFFGYALRMRARSHQVMKNMEKVRSDFFTNITHEFRTPLTVILGLSQQVKKENMSKEADNSLETIIRQGKALLSLVNQLLDISKIKSAIGKPGWRSGNIVVYIDMIAENYRIYATQKHIDLQFTSSEACIEMDFAPEYFKKIMRNLLSNALKFTPAHGQISITANKEKDTLLLKVKDTGVGIPPDDLSHIFEAFYQAESKSVDAGSGIGLSLVSHIIEQMNGTITVQSAENKGTEFTITLPLKQGKNIFEKWVSGNETDEDIYQLDEKRFTTSTQVNNDSPIDSEKPTILIIDDNTDVSYYIGSLLKDKYNLIYAENGKVGLEKALEYLPDLIVTDLMMPEMNGYALCEKIRKSIAINHIPIIIVSAKSEEADRVLGLDVGADAYLQKPFNTDELFVRIFRLLEQRRLLREKFSNALKTGEQQNIELVPTCCEFINQLNEVIETQISNNELNSILIADRLCLSRSQLNRKVLSLTGVNTTSYIMSLRMNKAKHLLSTTQKSISDVAIECGFQDLPYFSRVFKHEVGTSPKKYHMLKK